jgi:hypothetical protein
MQVKPTVASEKWEAPDHHVGWLPLAVLPDRHSSISLIQPAKFNSEAMLRAMTYLKYGHILSDSDRQWLQTTIRTSDDGVNAGECICQQ